MRYPVFQPYLNDDELMACKAALDCKFLGMGAFVGDFESALSENLKLGEDRHIVTLSTGHAALHVAMMALEIGQGDEVITPSFNNIADFQAISAVGAEPVFCDIDTKTLCIDPEKIEGLITPRTKAIITMDYGASLADQDTVNSLAKSHGIPTIHDAAHSFGSMYKMKPIGHQSDITMFSFDPIKNITCIDGGALVFKNDNYIEMFREMRMIGMSQNIETNYKNKRDWGYDVHRLGFRYHLANLHAAIGLSQLQKFDVIKDRRRKLYNTYLKHLDDNPNLQTQGELDSGVVPFIFCLRVPAEHRDGMKKHLLNFGIETGIHWTPGHMFSLYSNCKSDELAVTNKISSEILSLPFYPDLEIEDIDFICDKITNYFK